MREVGKGGREGVQNLIYAERITLEIMRKVTNDGVLFPAADIKIGMESDSSLQSIACCHETPLKFYFLVDLRL